jgi:hypothetical protein
MPTNTAAKTAKTSKRKVFSKSLPHNFFDQMEIMFGKSSRPFKVFEILEANNSSDHDKNNADQYEPV